MCASTTVEGESTNCCFWFSASDRLLSREDWFEQIMQQNGTCSFLEQVLPVHPWHRMNLFSIRSVSPFHALNTVPPQAWNLPWKTVWNHYQLSQTRSQMPSHIWWDCCWLAGLLWWGLPSTGEAWTGHQWGGYWSLSEAKPLPQQLYLYFLLASDPEYYSVHRCTVHMTVVPLSAFHLLC